MSEPTSETDPSDAIPAVIEALHAVEGLAQRPLDEHVVVFEQAHEQLRRALDAQP